MVLPDARDRQGQVGLGAAVATGTAPSADLIVVPSEGSSAENVTGGLAQARPSRSQRCYRGWDQDQISFLVRRW